MQRRPRSPGHNHHGSPSHQKIWLAAAVIFLVPFLSLADAKQPAHAVPPPPPHQHLRNDVARDHHDHDSSQGSQPVPDGGMVQNLAVTNLDDVAVRLETPVAQANDRIQRDDNDNIDHKLHASPPKQQHAARSGSSRAKQAPDSRRYNKGGKQQQQQQPIANGYSKYGNYDHIHIPDDASALATLAPAQAVRAPHPSRHLSSGNVHRGNAGLISPQVARSLEDWEVEDFVLLATVDGDLYANDRKTLKERWHLEVDQPMVETKHHRTNTSILDDDYNPIDHYIWAVEPTRDGGLFLWMPDSDAGLVRTGYTMKGLVEELAPFADEEPPVVYNGDKKTTLITLDAATGKVLKWFGSGGSHINEAESCSRPTTLQNIDPDECSSTGTITLGRTEYTVSIQRKDGLPIATIKYSEWGPNNYDADLLHQYHTSKDNRYFASQYDGNVYAFDPPGRHKPRTVEKFTTPVARVFDVCRPWDAPVDSNPELVVLPQPPMPSRDEEIERTRSQSIFLNQTAEGGWYVMSGRSYPLIIDAPTAQINQGNWPHYSDSVYSMGYDKMAQALIGTHRVEPLIEPGPEYPGLPAGPEIDHYPAEHPPSSAVFVRDGDDEGFLDKLKSLPRNAMDSVADLFRNPAMILVVALMIFTNQRSLRRSYHNFKEKGIDGVTWQFWKDSAERQDVAVRDIPDSARGDPDFSETKQTPVTGDPTLDRDDGTVNPVDREDATTPTQATVKVPSADDDGQEGEKAKGDPSDTPAGDGDLAAEANGETPKKKKAHRGRRGGVKHRKGKAKESSPSDGLATEAVDEAVSAAKRIVANRAGQVIRQEPDPVTAPWDSAAVGAQIYRVGNLEVNLDQQLGTGSNGTLVFAGKFDGRDVAVKRLLNSFTGLAERETQLLRESDDHPNVIRYYHMIEQGEFLYIALERCGASLANVIEKPQAFRELANAGRKDLPAVLYQITSGINHLHSLRIVHRDLKPQNILVSMGKDGKPRLLVSDFGLCKKLENEQSSFGATTGRAAGTSGWRAPELLIDDDDRDNGIVETDTQSGSGSILLNDGTVLSGKRATRSIDIFSLGLVYYYVLTNGSHPFDCGDKFMREVNIRRGNYNLDQLDSLGDWAFEAKNLIASMIQGDPKGRPVANDIMAHPFFWSAKKRLAFLCDVSDHFEKEQRDPPSTALQHLEGFAPEVISGDFLKALPRDFVDSLGKQRKYTGTRLLDLLRALRNKRNHYEDMSESLKRSVGSLPDGYLCFWTTRFPSLLIHCWDIVYNLELETSDRFREYYQPAGL